MKLKVLFESKIRWIKPNLSNEIADLELVGDHFGVDSTIIATRGRLTKLSEDLWSKLIPGDSFNIKSLEEVVNIAMGYGKSKDEIKKLIKAFQTTSAMEAPVVFWDGDYAEVGSGNTRLMISRALGITPSIWLVRTDG